jgi:ABC-2 type transport system permease protein
MELRRNLRSLIIWTLLISFLIFFTMSFFRTFLKYQEQIAGMIQVVPQVALKARGFGNIEDFFSVLGFYAANNIIYMMLLGSIYSIVLCSHIFMKEEYDKTAEFLMSRPLSRDTVFLTKVALAFIFIAVLNTLAAIVSLISIQVFKTGSFNLKPFLILTMYTFFLNWLFGAAGIFISAVIRRTRPMTFFSVGLVMICYFIYSISRMSGVNGDFGYLSPFKFVSIDILSPSYIVEFWRVAYFIFMILLLSGLSFFIFRRKDILT